MQKKEPEPTEIKGKLSKIWRSRPAKITLRMAQAVATLRTFGELILFLVEKFPL